MNAMIYHPLEEYDSKFKSLHADNTLHFFEELVRQSGVDPEENRKTVRQYNEVTENLGKLKKKLNLWRFLRVLMILTLVLIPLVILKITPKIKGLREEIAQADQKAAELMTTAQQQMEPLNRLFTDRDALTTIEQTIPSLSFAPSFSVEQEADMTVNYNFADREKKEESTLDVLAGHYNGNPFLFEDRLIHRMGEETYHGYKTIRWTETYRGSDGKNHTRTRSQTLHATLVKPKPFYHTQVVLNYCAQGGPELSFTRNATHLEQKSDKEIEKYIKKGEKKLDKMTDRAIKENRDFMTMSNSGFEVLFDALDRTNEVQFRTLFTPLAQTNMVDLIRSRSGYGDDFDFIKQQRTNKIITQHSQGRSITLPASAYPSYSFDTAKDNFLNKNCDFFKALYFDFAPAWAIPIYQEEPVQSLQPIPPSAQKYSCGEYETLANRIRPDEVVHPQTKTQAILKSSFVGSHDAADEVCISASSYDIISRVDLVPVYGNDGRWHDVPVTWDDYIPLEASHHFFVGAGDPAEDQSILAERDHVYMFR